MKIFLAGATGIVGQRLIPLLAASGHEVIGTTRRSSKAEMLKHLGAIPCVVDVFDHDGLAAAMQSIRPDVVIHQLTDLSEKDFVSKDFSATARIREIGTRNLVDAARSAGVERMIAQSVASWVYAPGEGPADENVPLDSQAPLPTRDIVTGVQALERTVAEMESWVLLRYGSLYGPGTAYAPNSLMADQVRHGQVSADDGITSFVHIDDAARAALLALDWPQLTVNIVDDEPARSTVWLPVYAASLGAPVPPVATDPVYPTRGASNARAHQILHWSPLHPSWRAGFTQLAQQQDNQVTTNA